MERIFQSKTKKNPQSTKEYLEIIFNTLNPKGVHASTTDTVDNELKFNLKGETGLQGETGATFDGIITFEGNEVKVVCNVTPVFQFSKMLEHKFIDTLEAFLST
jgi:hypothetical protein